MVKISPSIAGGVGSIPSWEAKIPHALWSVSQSIKKKTSGVVTNSIKTSKNGPH